MAVQGELPVWVSGQQLWVRGVDRKTTCNDVIAALLGHPEEGYVIVERWRRVERPLGGDTRLLKLWTTWGDAQDEVKLSLRRVSDDDSGRGSPASYTRRRKSHHHRHHSSHQHRQKQQQTQTLHPKRLAQMPATKTESIERLLKLILVQGETIQSQLQRLHEREDQIEHLEDETHKARVNMLGSNYVLETYLGDAATSRGDVNVVEEEEEEKENDSGVVTEGTPENTSTPTEDTKDEEDATIEEDIESEIQDLQKRIELWEKILKVNKRLEKEEENLVRLYVNFKRCDELCELHTELDKKREELDRGAREIEINSCTLSETESIINARRRHLRILQSEIEASDLETERLIRASESACAPATKHSVPHQQQQQQHQHRMVKCVRDFDNNSDTGLSSLHSSSEEGTYVLDTLV